MHINLVFVSFKTGDKIYIHVIKYALYNDLFQHSFPFVVFTYTMLTSN